MSRVEELEAEVRRLRLEMSAAETERLRKELMDIAFPPLPMTFFAAVMGFMAGAWFIAGLSTVIHLVAR